MIHIDPADVAAMARDLRRIESLLEESPVPDREWPRVLAVFDRDRLAPLLGISPSSAVRYARHWQKLQQFRGGAMFSERFLAARLVRLQTRQRVGAFDDGRIVGWHGVTR